MASTRPDPPCEPKQPDQLNQLSMAGLYREHAQLVHRIARHLGVPAGQAEDVVQETFLVVQRKLDTFDGTTPMRAWLFGITRRVVWHHQRSWSRWYARLRRAWHDETEPASAEPSEAVALVHRIFAAMPADKQRVLYLCDVEGFTAPEVATALGLKLNTVYSRLRLARAHFVAQLEQVRDD